MPAKRGRYLYWDSSVFLAYIGGEPGRVEMIDAVWSEIIGGQANRIVTSMIAVAEVAFSTDEKTKRVLDPNVAVRIDQMWQDPTILRVEMPFLITQMARNLMRQVHSMPQPQPWTLKPYDAVHLATALWMHQNIHPIDAIHTYEPKWKKFAPLIGIPIDEPSTINPIQLRFT